MHAGWDENHLHYLGHLANCILTITVQKFEDRIQSLMIMISQYACAYVWKAIVDKIQTFVHNINTA